MNASMKISNPDLWLAEEFVRHTACNIFLTGKAGTGKTTFLHAMQQQNHKRIVVTAPTGVAAINAGGVTLHSFFQIPLGPFVPGGEAYAGPRKIRREKQNIIRSLDLLVIDEVSMVRSDLLDAVDAILRSCRHSEEPFGGVQLLMIGDLHQLSPVVKQAEWELLRQYYASPYFFSSVALGRTELIPIELKHIYRQSDQRFIDLLNKVRDNRIDPSALEALNARHIPDFSPGRDKGYITLSTHNSGADAVNRVRLGALPGKSRWFKAEVEGDFPEQLYPAAFDLELKIGAQVMFIRNDMSAEKIYFNGKIGKVTAISEEVVTVQCPDDPLPIPVEKCEWENIEYRLDPNQTEILIKVIGTFRQYPLKPAWAITIHKSQGLTFDRAIIDARAAFAFGQIYVALSRCRTLEGIVLSSPLTASAVKINPAVACFTNAAAANAPSPDRLAAAKNHYQQQLLLKCFSFESLRRSFSALAALLRNHAGLIQVSTDSDIEQIQQQLFAQIFTVGEKFKHQLQGMFSGEVLPADDPAILERLRKAAAYFQEKFELILFSYLDHLSVETDNKEIRKQIQKAMKQVSAATIEKLAGILSCGQGFSPQRYLRALSVAAIEIAKPKPAAQEAAYTEADVGHPELFAVLRQWRTQKADDEKVAPFQILHQKVLIQIAIRLPDTIAELKKIKGIGKRLAARYGHELTTIVADFRRKHGITEVSLPEPKTATAPPKRSSDSDQSNTKHLSLELFKQGMTIEQIAAKRGLVVSTIESHLAFFVERGELEVTGLVPDEKQHAIARQYAATRSDSLKTLKTALGDDYSYGEIRLVLAHLRHLEKVEG